MSYKVLARRNRPQKFEEVVGQEPVVRTLKNALSRDRVAHAMIFSGVRGVGKTTIARIMAKALNCHNPEEAPCDRCPSCLAVIKGNSLDLHEIDGASNRGIQEIRDLKENIRFMPVAEKFKVVIIDEVHMLTTEAFNALLKTLEEPPGHVFFMFATTEIHKVPVTILSRCQRYELKRVPFRTLADFFAGIASREGVSISPGAVDIIASEADGSVRDGLSLLDQILSFGGESITEEDLSLVLGLVDRRVFARIIASLLASDLPGALALLHETYSQGMDLKRFALGLLAFCRALLIVRTSKTPAAILDLSEQELAQVEAIAARHALETIAGAFHLLMRGVEDMQRAIHPRMALELIFVKIAQLGVVVPVSELVSRLDALIAGCPPALPSEPEPVVAPRPDPADRPPVSSVNESAVDVSLASAAARSGEVMPAPRPPAPLGVSESGGWPRVGDEAGPAPSVSVPGAGSLASEEKPALAVGPGPEAVLAPAPARPRREVRRDWDDFVVYVRERKPWMALTLNQADKAREEGGGLALYYDEPSECHLLQENENLRLLTEFAQDFFQRELTVRVLVAGESRGADLEQPQEERRALARDPRVRVALEVFGGQVAGIRTEPRSR